MSESTPKSLFIPKSAQGGSDNQLFFRDFYLGTRGKNDKNQQFLTFWSELIL